MGVGGVVGDERAVDHDSDAARGDRAGAVFKGVEGDAEVARGRGAVFAPGGGPESADGEADAIGRRAGGGRPGDEAEGGVEAGLIDA